MNEPPLLEPAFGRQKSLALTPTFLGGLRGIWLFTWKAQLTWRRFGMILAGLFALPTLVYLTTPSPDAWAQSHRLHMGNPNLFLNTVSKRLARKGVPLQSNQKVELLGIIREEYTHTADRWSHEQSTETSVDPQRQEVENCHERIRRRAEKILDERQFGEFQTYQPPHPFEPPPPLVDLLWNRTAPFYHWLIDVYFFILLPLNCIRMCGALIRDELDADTLGFLTTRPLSRARLLLVKYISQTAWLQIWMLVQTCLLFAAGSFRQVPTLANLLPLFVAAQFLAIFSWSALGLFLGQISKRYMALALVYGSIVEMGIGRIPTNINTLSLMRHLKTLLGHDPALQSIYNWSAVGVLGPIGALLLATIFFLTLAALMFTYKEYHHTIEMQK